MPGNQSHSHNVPKTIAAGRRGSRARVVCHRCHHKKIRCDLETPRGRCSNCTAEGVVCEYRPSHKGQRSRKVAVRPSLEPTNAISSPPTESGPGSPPPPNGGSITTIRPLLGHQAHTHRSQLALQYQSNQLDVDQVTHTPTPSAPHDFAPGVLSAYLHTYFEIHYAWFPVLDPGENRNALSSDEIPLLLRHAIACISGATRMPLLSGLSSPREHYERARQLFHAERSLDVWNLLRAAIFLSYADNSILGSSMDGSFWWIGIAIRLAQDLRLHRKPRSQGTTEATGLQRRIWWTLYARERTAALFQGRPCIIDEDYCNVDLPQVSDFPAAKSYQAQIFVHWVSLCRTMGQVQKYMLDTRQNGNIMPTSSIATSLTTWLDSLPATIRLPMLGTETMAFESDVHLLHLPYLTLVSLTYLSTSGPRQAQISVAAILAATCTARIIQDFLLRGSVDVLPEDTGWSIAIAITALTFVCPIQKFGDHARADIAILLSALEHLSVKWTSSKILLAGLKRLLDASQQSLAPKQHELDYHRSNAFVEEDSTFVPGTRDLDDLRASDGIFWTSLFPFASAETSALFKALISESRDISQPMSPTSDFYRQFDSFWDEFAMNHPDWLWSIS